MSIIITTFCVSDDLLILINAVVEVFFLVLLLSIICLFLGFILGFSRFLVTLTFVEVTTLGIKNKWIYFVLLSLFRNFAAHKVERWQSR